MLGVTKKFCEHSIIYELDMRRYLSTHLNFQILIVHTLEIRSSTIYTSHIRVSEYIFIC